MPEYTSISAQLERVRMYYGRLIQRYSCPENQPVNSRMTVDNDDDYWAVFGIANSLAAFAGLLSLGAERNSLYLHDTIQSSSASPMERFLTLTTVETPQPWLARITMQTIGFVEGDYFDEDIRCIGFQF